MPDLPLPVDIKKVLLVNPTKYLGNLLLAGGLIQAYARHCQQQNIELRIVLDESFRELCENSFPTGSLIYFPRGKIKRAGLFKKLSVYRECLKKIRSFRADLAFNLEEDSATSHLTRLSGAKFKLGCSPLRHKSGYDHVVPVDFENRQAGRSHRWYSFYDIFSVLGMAEPQKSYLDLALESFPETLKRKLNDLGWNPELKTIALHAGATKQYKQWPPGHMAVLIEKIMDAGIQPVLLGAGNNDESINAEIIRLLKQKGSQQLPLDLCNQLSLLELAQFLTRCSLMVGNDSGPFHLGSALGIPGLVLWGPTNKAIWGPLGEQSDIIQGSFPCDPACNKGHCLHDHRCLMEISPDQVFKKICEADPLL